MNFLYLCAQKSKMFFRDVIGQDEMKRYLTSMVRKGVIPHALMFSGEAGYGTFQLALAYARYLNCTDRSETDACGRCRSCVKYNALAHPDLHLVFPMVKDAGKKKEICDDYLPEWRSFLQEQSARRAYFDIDDWLAWFGAEQKVALIYEAESESIIHKMTLRIYEADFRVLFIWLPERMNESCSNKLLKLIEEPFDNTAIVMVTSEPDALLGTIYSRSQLIHVRPLQAEIIEKELITKYDIDVETARQTAHFANGNYLKAMRQMEGSEEEKYFLLQFQQMMRNGWSRNIVGMKKLADEMKSFGRDRQKAFLAFCQRQIRENFLLSLAEPSLNYLSEEEAAFASKFHYYVNERNVEGMMEEFALAEQHIGQNVNSAMVFFDLSMRITVLVRK